MLMSRINADFRTKSNFESMKEFNRFFEIYIKRFCKREETELQFHYSVLYIKYGTANMMEILPVTITTLLYSIDRIELYYPK